MRTTICDICGKPIDHTNVYEIPEGLFVKIRPYKRWITYEYDSNAGAIPVPAKSEIDICEKCMNDMFQWIRKRRRTNEW